MKIAVLGAGKMAHGVAYFLNTCNEVNYFFCYDNYLPTFQSFPRKFLEKKGRIGFGDITTPDVMTFVLKNEKYDCIISTLPDPLFLQTAEVAIRTKINLIALGADWYDTNNPNKTEKELRQEIHEKAMNAGIVIVEKCGLAPGFISDLGIYIVSQFDNGTVNELIKYCGGLPQYLIPGKSHQCDFSFDGLTREIFNKPKIIKNGKVIEIEPLSENHNVYFSNLKKMFEATPTYAGFNADPKIWRNIKNVSYLTLRHPGHWQQIVKIMSSAKKTEERNEKLKKLLMPTGHSPDMIVLRVTASGKINGKKERVYYDSIDYADKSTGLSAMQRYTAFPATITALQTIRNSGWPKGVVPHELFVDMNDMLSGLLKHNIKVKKYHTIGI